MATVEDAPAVALAAAVAGVEQAATGRFEGRISTESSGGAPPGFLSMGESFEGAYDLAAGRSWQLVESSGWVPMSDRVTESITDGSTVYARAARDRAALESARWTSFEVPDPVLAPFDQMLGSTPTGPASGGVGLLEQLREVGEVVERDRTELRGVSVRHLVATIDLGAELRRQFESVGDAGDVPAFLDLSEMAAAFDGLTLEVGVFVDDAGAIRRITATQDLGAMQRRVFEVMPRVFESMEGDFGGFGEDRTDDGGGAVPPMAATEAWSKLFALAFGARELIVRVEIDFFDLGMPVDITLPDAAEVDARPDEWFGESEGAFPGPSPWVPPPVGDAPGIACEAIEDEDGPDAEAVCRPLEDADADPVDGDG